jgi:hypothetical protein
MGETTGFQKLPETINNREIAAEWRQKAKELYAIAEDVVLEETKRTLLGLAHGYERRAIALERAITPEAEMMNQPMERTESESPSIS